LKLTLPGETAIINEQEDSAMGNWGYWDYWQFPKPEPARVVKGGIKAQSKRGDFGQNWWAKRWTAILESFGIGARLSRGRSYARRGQVMNVDIAQGKVKARVQGSRPRPYNVTIEIKTLSGYEWKQVARALSGEAIFAAKLLAGEMPQDIENIFKQAGVSLFPAKQNDLVTDCSCPDWSNPCKHIAAVYYLLGEEFDRDPFLLFRLRGKGRDEIVDLLGTIDTGETSKRAAAPSATREPIAANYEGFWHGGELPADFYGEIVLPSVPAAQVRRLGNFPFWRGSERFFDAIEPMYADASARGMDLFLGS
jgi:uncharacterized Zn finger protein